MILLALLVIGWIRLWSQPSWAGFWGNGVVILLTVVVWNAVFGGAIGRLGESAYTEPTVALLLFGIGLSFATLFWVVGAPIVYFRLRAERKRIERLEALVVGAIPRLSDAELSNGATNLQAGVSQNGVREKRQVKWYMKVLPSAMERRLWIVMSLCALCFGVVHFLYAEWDRIRYSSYWHEAIWYYWPYLIAPLVIAMLIVAWRWVLAGEKH